MIRWLQVRDFRCFREARLEFVPGHNCLVGPNAAGKTSLLEAVAVLLRLQSPRTRFLGNLVRERAPAFALEGECAGRKLEFRFGARERRLAIDAVDQRRPDLYLGIGRAVCFANPDMDLVRGGAEARRRYLDALALQAVPAYGALLRAYDRALRARNVLLKTGGGDPRPLRAYEGTLVRAAAQLGERRAALVSELAGPIARACRALGGEQLDAVYRRGWQGDYAEALAAARETDARLGHTTVGPHRDDLELRLGGRDVGEFASEGQQRGVVLALRVAEGEVLSALWRSTPVYLIDDIFGELDVARRNRLLTLLPGAAQKIVTSTDLHWLAPGTEVRTFRIAVGEVIGPD